MSTNIPQPPDGYNSWLDVLFNACIRDGEHSDAPVVEHARAEMAELHRLLTDAVTDRAEGHSQLIELEARSVELRALLHECGPRPHMYFQDGNASVKCPALPDYYCGKMVRQPEPCTCGADEWNERFRKALGDVP